LRLARRCWRSSLRQAMHLIGLSSLQDEHQRQARISDTLPLRPQNLEPRSV
jgi:hypothetical protein